MSGGGTNTSYTYDDMGRLATEQSGNITKQYTYDAANDRKSLVINQNGAAKTNTTYDYDTLNRLWHTYENAQLTATYTYDNNGNRQSLVYSNGDRTDYQYNLDNKLKVLTNKNVATPLSKYTYEYNLDGSQASKTDLAGKITQYLYDGLGRLSSETDRVNGAVVTSNTYTYDDSSNRKTMDVTGTNASSTAYSYDANNGLTTETKIQGTETDTTSYSYDDNGNQICKSTSVEKPLAGGEVETFGTSILGSTGANRKFYLFNGHGDVIQLTGTDGSVVKAYDYDAFGNEKNIDPNDTNVFRYCGEYFDKETGTIYLRARYYDPATGRFISEDSYDDPSNLNLYTYCANDPSNFFDPSGHELTANDKANLSPGDRMLISYYSDMYEYNQFMLKISSYDDEKQDAYSYMNYYHSKVVQLREKYDPSYSKWDNYDYTHGGASDGNTYTDEDIKSQIEESDKAYDFALFSLGLGMPSVSDGEGEAVEGEGTCFTEDTLVSTKNGHKLIKDINVGDEVYSENPETGEKGLKEVKNVYIHETDTLIHISVGNAEINTTPTHPFWVVDKGWVRAGELNVGDKLLLSSGQVAEIGAISKELLKKPIKVYNFEVEDWHTYFVSDENVLVHNTCNIPTKVGETLNKIEENGGKAPQGYAGGVEYRNQPNTKLGETKIPNKNVANYTEYDVNEFNGWNNRGTERIVTGDDGTAWYTSDHYKTWIQIK